MWRKVVAASAAVMVASPAAAQSGSTTGFSDSTADAAMTASESSPPPILLQIHGPLSPMKIVPPSKPSKKETFLKNAEDGNKVISLTNSIIQLIWYLKNWRINP